MRYLSLFSGIEAATVAWQPLGFECVAVAEIEPFPCKVLAHHYPDVPNLGDITKITQEQIEALGQVDLVVGGFPCQDLSVAGLRKGLKNDDGSATRSGLFYTALQIAKWSKARWLLLENVPGIYSSNNGRDFAAMVGAILDTEFTLPKNGWKNSGIACSETGLLEWRTLDAQYFRVPQRRRRMFALADFGNWVSRPPILFEQHSLQGHPAPSRKTRQDITEIAGTLDANSGGLNRSAGNANELDFCIAKFDRQSRGEYGDASVASTMSARDYKSPSDLIAYNITFCDANGRRSDRKDGGLYVSQTDVANTLTKAGIGTHAVQAVAFGVGESHNLAHCLRSGASKADNAVVSIRGTCSGKETFGTLMANCGTKQWLGNQEALSGDYPVFALAGNTIGRKPENGGNGNGYDDSGVSYTLTKTDQHAVAFKIRGGCEGGGKGYLGQDNLAFTLSTNQDQHLFTNLQVRRLTPLECARLQGFNDDYLSQVKGASDSAMYKALGNSMAVPCMTWIGKQIMKVQDERNHNR